MSLEPMDNNLPVEDGATNAETTPQENETVAEEVVEETVEETVEEVVEKPKKAAKGGNGSRRRLRYGSAATAVTAIVIVAVILLNVIVGIVADRFPITLDLSSEKLYSISADSEKVIDGVKDELEIVVFKAESYFENCSEGAQYGFPEYDTTMKQFLYMLKQYEAKSNGKIHLSFIDPNQNPTKFAAYQTYGVTDGNILILYNERYKMFTVDDLYLLDTSSYNYTGSYEFESKAERVLASTVYNLTAREDTLIQVLIGHDEDSYVIDGLKGVYELNGYSFEELAINGSQEFNPNATVALIAAPTTDYTAEEIKKIQTWVYNDGNYGRHLMVFTSPTVDCPNLYELLEVEYKIRVTDELLLETDFARIQSYNQLYPLCDVPSTEYTKDAVSTGKVYTPSARRLLTTLSEKNEESTIDTYGIQLTEYPETAQLMKLSDAIGEAEDKSDKAYAPAAEQYPMTSMMVCVMDGYNNNTGTATNGTVFVSGCSAAAYESIITQSNYKNEELFLETINGMTGAEEGLSISTKKLNANYVYFSDQAQLLIGIVGFTIGLPLIVLIICIIVFIRRRRL